MGRVLFAVAALGVAVFAIRPLITSEPRTLPPETPEEVRSLLLANAMRQFALYEGRAPSSIQELQNYPAARILSENVWNYVQPLQEGQEPPPGYAGWRVENGQLVLYARYRDQLVRLTAKSNEAPGLEGLRALKQHFAPTEEEAAMFFLCVYLGVLGRLDSASLEWFRSPYEGHDLKWSTLQEPQPVSVTRLQAPDLSQPLFVCWDADTEPVNPFNLRAYAIGGGRLPADLQVYVREYEEWAEANSPYLVSPGEVRTGGPGS